jgi:hypothetical protein
MRSSELRTTLTLTDVHPSSLILFTLGVEAIRFLETSVVTRVTQRHILQDDFL